MSPDSDLIVDRRRIRRKLTFWRVVAALIAIAAIVAVGAIATRGRGADGIGLDRAGQDRGADPQRQRSRRGAGAAGELEPAAVIIHINSPGGTTAGSEQLYDCWRG